MDSRVFRHTLGHYPTGVCAITATLDVGEDVAMIVGSFTSVSLDPPLVGFFPARNSKRWKMIERAGKFCVNVLSGDHQLLCRQLSSQASGSLAAVSRRTSANGSPILADAIAWIDCDIDRVIETGDHYLVLGRVLDLGTADAGIEAITPLLFFRGLYGGFVNAAAG